MRQLRHAVWAVVAANSRMVSLRGQTESSSTCGIRAGQVSGEFGGVIRAGGGGGGQLGGGIRAGQVSGEFGGGIRAWEGCGPIWWWHPRQGRLVVSLEVSPLGKVRGGWERASPPRKVQGLRT
jgi:hypothetical protein